MQDLFYTLLIRKPKKHPGIKCGNVFFNQMQRHKLKATTIDLYEKPLQQPRCN